MDITGTGITPISVKIKPQFKPITELALNWTQTADGNYYAQDRGVTSDIYQAEFEIYRWESDINDFLNEYQNNRDADSHILTFSNFTDTEYIFGADVDHSSINATVLDISTRKQGSFKGFGARVKVQALSPSFIGTASLPNLKQISIGYKADASITMNKYDSYDGSFSYVNYDYDSGIFEGDIILKTEDMRNMRKYLTSQRGTSFNIAALYGVDNPFGPRRSNSYPLAVKCISWRDRGMIDIQRWRMSVKFAEVI